MQNQKSINEINSIPCFLIKPIRRRQTSTLGILGISEDGGERGIRTLGAACGSTHDFQSCSFSQLGHLSFVLVYQVNS
jgi:hypothetical protein